MTEKQQLNLYTPAALLPSSETASRIGATEELYYEASLRACGPSGNQSIVYGTPDIRERVSSLFNICH